MANLGDWSDDQIEGLKRLWAMTPPLSQQQIADRLGVTKSAVAGKRFRLGLAPREGGGTGGHVFGRRVSEPRSKSPAKAAPAASAPVPREPLRLVPAAPPEPPPAPATTPPALALPEHRHTPHRRCQWVTQAGRGGQGWMFCGDPTRDPGTSWCAAHAAVVFAQKAPAA